VLAVLAGAGRAVRGDPVDGDQRAVNDYVGVPGLAWRRPGRGQPGRARAASSATVSLTYLRAVAVPTPEPGGGFCEGVAFTQAGQHEQGLLAGG
jgi:hypothetical protein